MNSRFLWLAVGLVATTAVMADDPAPNTLTDAERQAGWQLLFDGKTTSGWRAFHRDAFPGQGWEVADGCIRHLPRGGGGDLVTTRTFSNYEFRFDWRINPGGNSGIKYLITETRKDAIGHEYQLLGARSREEASHDLKHATASFYDVLPVGTNAFPNSPGEWNSSRILVDGNHVEHWLNGERVLTYELGSPEVQAGIAQSKFREVAGFGTAFPHHILLQDHGGEVWFRNLKIRPIKP